MPCWRRTEEGSLTLEAAVILPLLLMYIALLYALSLSLRADMLWHEAARSAIREFSLAASLCQDESVSSEISAEDLFSPEHIPLKIAADSLGTAFLQKRQNYWFEKNCRNSGISPLFIAEPYGFIEKTDGRLYYSYSYRQPLDPAYSLREARLPLPFWGGSEFANKKLLPKINDEYSARLNSIWEEPALTRGRYFREIEGAGLPYGYPVIASFQNGEAKSIKSMDLTAPTYQNEAELRRHLGRHLTHLAAFEGSRDWGKEAITISPESIQKKSLALIIPENSPPELIRILADEKKKAQSLGIELNWYFRGISSKYVQQE